MGIKNWTTSGIVTTEVYTAIEASRITNVSVMTIRAWAERGIIRPLTPKFGSRKVVLGDALKRAIRGRKSTYKTK